MGVLERVVQGFRRVVFLFSPRAVCDVATLLQRVLQEFDELYVGSVENIGQVWAITIWILLFRVDLLSDKPKCCGAVGF